MTDNTDPMKRYNKEYETVRKGALTYLVDSEGRAVSEGYHEIWKDNPDIGSEGRVHYYGKRGAVENLIAIIPEDLRGAGE